MWLRFCMSLLDFAIPGFNNLHFQSHDTARNSGPPQFPFEALVTSPRNECAGISAAIVTVAICPLTSCCQVPPVEMVHAAGPLALGTLIAMGPLVCVSPSWQQVLCTPMLRWQKSRWFRLSPLVFTVLPLGSAFMGPSACPRSKDKDGWLGGVRKSSLLSSNA